MGTRSIRFADDIEEMAKAYSDRLGISFNAVVQVALTEYLGPRAGKNKAREGAQVEKEASPAELNEGKGEFVSRQQRRAMERDITKARGSKIHPAHKSTPIKDH